MRGTHVTAAVRIGCVFAGIVIVRAHPVATQPVPVAELKAAITTSLAPYIEWPAEALPANDRLLFCVVNDNGVAEALERTIRGRSVATHSLALRSLDAAAPLPACQIVYVAGDDARRTLDVVRGTPGVFTVGDAGDFIARGGMVRIFRRDGRLRFEVNLDAVQRAGLKLSSRVLTLADSVRDARGPVSVPDRR